ncbi:GNAT family N-acetyltransferase [Modestobacter italicus]|uniref:GNAT family N-acetyltransferase n=1 Tax=Modestobacter italicus (strain DSM 44449 / CECT 9708 / BC 501) TaxID=2732864 RepID=UPI001C97545A|nr:GNAT family N-acetyltransferase [Modestobacter italicus]
MSAGTTRTARVTAPAEDDWAVVRAVRLTALADAPDAFDSSLDREQALTEADWRARLRAGGQRLAWLGDDAVGLARGLVHETAGGVEHHLVGMWVAPAARGSGAAGGLVEAVTDWARELGATRLFLWVVGENGAAAALYRRHGFVPTGRVQPLPTRPWQTERQYARDLA